MDINLTEEKCWQLIEEANWQLDHNYDRIQLKYSKLSYDELKQLDKFVNKKLDELSNKYDKFWLGNPGIPVSDDGWFDLKAEVIGRGKKFYESISVEKLIQMANESDYYENFLYSLHVGI